MESLEKTLLGDYSDLEGTTIFLASLLVAFRSLSILIFTQVLVD